MGASAIYRQLTGERRAEHTQNEAKLPISRFSGTLRQPLRGPSLRVRKRHGRSFEKEYAAGMPQVILSAAREQAEQPDPQACNGFLLNVPCASHFPSLATYGGTDRLFFGTRSHEQIGRTRA